MPQLKSRTIFKSQSQTVHLKNEICFCISVLIRPYFRVLRLIKTLSKSEKCYDHSFYTANIKDVQFDQYWLRVLISVSLIHCWLLRLGIPSGMKLETSQWRKKKEKEILDMDVDYLWAAVCPQYIPNCISQVSVIKTISHYTITLLFSPPNVYKLGNVDLTPQKKRVHKAYFQHHLSPN